MILRGNRLWRVLGPILVCLGIVVGTSSAQAQAPAPNAVAATCEALMTTDLTRIPDAPTQIVSAKIVPAAGRKPSYCEAEGYVAPQVGILMRLPVAGWNGRFLEVGCGGYCGMFTFIALCDGPLQRGYACITTDMGHKGKEAEGVEWAYNNPQAVIDFAYRATHVTALAGKAIATSYYGKAPDRSYFQGCSCGGRQALVEAERFPWDFNGIIVGAPAISYIDITLDYALRARDLHDAAGKPLLDAAAIRLLGQAVVAKCDMNDGVKDGLIGDPRLCRFDPHAIVCRAGATADCLSPVQANAAAAFYTEQKSASGDVLGERSYPPGTETSVLGLAETGLMKGSFYADFYRYLALVPNPGPNWTFAQFDLDRDYKRLGLARAMLDADYPDLSRFKAAGGKLIFYHGWADGGPSPLNSVDLYRRIEATMGGRAATDDFLRLYMIPDTDHCFGGRGPWTVDFLSYLEKWVEGGRAPDVLIGAHYVDYAPLGTTFDDAKPVFTRPIYPYPFAARYKGAGDPNDAASYRPVKIQP